MGTLEFKGELQKKFDKLKTDDERIKFIIKGLKRDSEDVIWPHDENRYMLGSIWNPVIFDKKLFNKIKPQLEKQQECETGGVYYFWTLKGKY